MEKERLKYTIDRFDQYFDGVNNKSNIVLGFGTLIFGSLVAVYPSLTKVVEFNWIMHANFGILVTLGFVSMLILIFTSIPHLESSGKSIHFFQSISNMGESAFITKSKNFDIEEEIKDLREQVFHLANGLSKKFKRLRIALILLGIQMILMIPYIALITTHLK